MGNGSHRQGWFTRRKCRGLVGSLAIVVGLAELAGVGAAVLAADEAVAPVFTFRDGDRVVLLGAAFIERLQMHGYLETALTAGLADRQITFRNLGWSGDTVWGDARAVFGTRADGRRRQLRDVILCRPTVLIVCYGENEAWEGDAGLESFRRGLNELMDELASLEARWLLLGPRKHDHLGPPLPDPAPYNAMLRKYNDVTAQVAAQRGAAFLDLYDAPGATENGLHLSREGEIALVRYLLPRLGVSDFPFESLAWDALRTAIRQKNELFFHRYRPQNETYLFLFRKHEQGNNAVEIPMFDPLIAEKENEIARLKQPVR
jgi:lysophospholipase L1-like esterase